MCALRQVGTSSGEVLVYEYTADGHSLVTALENFTPREGREDSPQAEQQQAPEEREEAASSTVETAAATATVDGAGPGSVRGLCFSADGRAIFRATSRGQV